MIVAQIQRVHQPFGKLSKMPVVIPLILSGGSGTRLWPMSSNENPKQFLRLVSEQSLFQETVLRTQMLGSRAAAPIVVCNEAHRFLVAEQLRELDVAPHAIVLEPKGRNTAPAVAVAALLARESADSALLAVLPADHVIANGAAFAAALEAAIEAAAEGRLVTFGVVPDRPETGYGYLLRGPDRGRWSVLEKFVEKPDLATAQRYVDSGRYLWNSGMFVFGAETYLRELARLAPRILEATEAAVAEAARDRDFVRLGAAFAACPSDSIDYAVMEKTDKAAVVPLDAGWSDVGSWSALHDVLDKDASGNVLRGEVLASGCRNSYIAANGRLVAALGLEGLVVVATDDAVLVMSRDEAQSVKQIVDRLMQKQRG
jgi:mannose-1-phosphate guanylyltransferase/mannose-6-phosphate isomerase